MSKKYRASDAPVMRSTSFVMASSGKRKWADNVTQPDMPVTITRFDPKTRVKTAPIDQTILRNQFEFKKSYR